MFYFDRNRSDCKLIIIIINFVVISYVFYLYFIFPSIVVLYNFNYKFPWYM